MIVTQLCLALLSLAPAAQANSHDSLAGAVIRAPAVRAARLAGELTVDGIPSEAAWETAGPVTDFIQLLPYEGAAATEQTEVRVLYDDDALYIGARLYDRAPDSVASQLARRDRDARSDRFIVYLDSYHDGRTGFFFGVNAAGTLYDGTLYNDEWDDDTWDGVWDGSAMRDSLGWTAELRIPYSQLRFQKGGDYRWGINFGREIARRNERDYLVYRPSNGSGFVSRFLALEGMQDVTPPPRLELLPYFTTRAEFLGHEAADPFNDGSRYAAGAGADLKLGLGANLTLAATVNPDFGQVEVDPAVVNLSDVETFFEERRPFFIEGASIFDFGYGGANDFWGFNWANPTFLYTRRIGRTPQAEQPDADYTEVPAGTSIIGAAKLSGKVGSWSLGALNAVTSREHGSFALGDRQWREELEPPAYYGVYRAQKEFDGGHRGLGAIATTTARSFGAEPLRDELSSTAFTLGVDGWTSLDRDRVWVMTGGAGASRVGGSQERLQLLQEGSVRYFQRPDADYLDVDSSATSLTGFAGRVTLNKQKGDWMFNSAFGLVDPRFEVNDLGFQSRGDQLNGSVVVGRRWTKPSRHFRSFRLNLATFRTYNFGGNLTWDGYFLTGVYQLKNFYDGRWFVAYNPPSFTDRQSRGGPLMVNPPGVEWDFQLSSDANRRWVVGLVLHGNHYSQGADQSWSIRPSLAWKPGGRFSLELVPELQRSRTSAQYVDTFDDPLATGTFGHRYLFAGLDQTTLSASLRLDLTFTPRLSLELYAQPLLSSGRYAGFKELARARSYAFNPYPDPTPTDDPDRIVVDPDGPAGPAPAEEIDDPNFSLASLRGNAVLRWEYSPGSTFFLVWTQNRSDTETIGGFDTERGLRRLGQTAGDNIFLMKVAYWWNP
ncbi:MAG: carbohydrate binding family 9 domain-containing protein [Gemmatimonadales bacterium]|nr:carbohydrate binding family 9 domain-containing protein [Gemmatimonadales bacterium]